MKTSGKLAIYALAATLALAALGGTVASAKPKHHSWPSCARLLTKKQIMEVNGDKPVELVPPNTTSAVGDWAEGPRSACFANYYVAGAQPGDILEVSAIWGLGFGLTSKQWNKIKSDEGGPNSVEGSGPWSRQTAKVNRPGTQAFIATTTALVGPGEEPTHFLYVLTKKRNLVYLEIDGATPTQLTTIAGKALEDHPGI